MPADLSSIEQLGRALRAGTTSAERAVGRCLARIAERDGLLNAFIAVYADDALSAARQADRELAAGRDRGPLHGVPVSLKDLIDVRGRATTAASRVRSGHVAGADAPLVVRLREAGAVLIGKTNLHEFAFGTTNEDSAFGPVRHPLDRERSPGGSSGGSAVSVADGMAFASIGTDTGGSVRIPAAACGLVGLKPSYGEIPTDGVVPLSATLDHVGPLCRSVSDAGLVYDALRGARPASIKVDEAAGLRLGVPRHYFQSRLDEEVATVFEEACARLRTAGVQLEDVQIAHAGETASIYLAIVLAEAAAYHARTLDSRPDDYTPNVRLRLEMGRYLLAEDYVRALRGREVLTAAVHAALAGRDGLLLPALAVPATPLGAETVRLGGVDEPIRAAMLRLTQLFNVTGHPAIAVPCGHTAEGLPVGAQLVGPAGDTPGLLRAARAVEPYLNPGGPA